MQANNPEISKFQDSTHFDPGFNGDVRNARPEVEVVLFILYLLSWTSNTVKAAGLEIFHYKTVFKTA